MINDPGDDTPVDTVLADFSALLARDQSFLLMSEKDMTDTEQSPANGKKVALWMKANKAEMRRLIRGHIHVQPERGKRLAAKAFALATEKAFGHGPP
ncbi:hypothetical protein [Paracoccus aerodenitrificans]|uniref:hypothetical protein n=1 Tax=Paracoccus aerodenitrificans TaxID=3017781 RepID=UPI0022F09E7B|nr:hypothetical protein [Paracoccus aerodenitrificans]WBU65775.1 hypothetical protein PAE61_05725 [Paracoccus aerodenitrificans]